MYTTYGLMIVMWKGLIFYEKTIDRTDRPYGSGEDKTIDFPCKSG